MRRYFALMFLSLASLAAAQSGTFVTYTTSWNGLTRQYSVYTPLVLQRPPALVVALHGTSNTAPSAPPITVCTNGMGWTALADVYGFVVLCPISTWKPISGRPGAFFWQSYGTDTYFPVTPDDSGFLRSLILQMEAQGGVDPTQVFVMGFSSGGMMAHRACIDSADLIAACAVLSGPAWIGNSSVQLPALKQRVSLLEMHGDADVTIPYCGGKFLGWGEGALNVPSVDFDLNYWLTADGLPANTMPLCTAGVPSGFRIRTIGNGVEIQFVRELNFAHTYKPTTVAAVWEFLSNHAKGN